MGAVAVSLLLSLGAASGMGPALVAYFLLSWGYGAFCEGVFNGQTPGKRALGLRVVSERGVPITGAQAVLRNLVGTVDGLVPFFFMLGLSSMLLSGKFQRLGDLAAGTMVIIEHASPDSVCSVFRSRACGPSSTVCRCGSGPARTWRGPCLIMSGVVTGSAAPCGKRWPSRWPGRSGLDMACRRLSRPTLCFAPSITGSFWASERTRSNAVRAETG